VVANLISRRLSRRHGRRLTPATDEHNYPVEDEEITPNVMAHFKRGAFRQLEAGARGQAISPTDGRGRGCRPDLK